MKNAILGKNHKIILQFRNVLDTVVSLKEQIDKSGPTFWIKIPTKEWVCYNDTEKYDLIIDYYVPWHIEFITTWLIQNDFNYLLLNYNDVVDSTTETFSRVLDFVDHSHDKNSIADFISEYKNKKINKNVGEKNVARNYSTRIKSNELIII